MMRMRLLRHCRPLTEALHHSASCCHLLRLEPSQPGGGQHGQHCYEENPCSSEDRFSRHDRSQRRICRLLRVATQNQQPSIEEDDYDAVEDALAGASAANAPHPSLILLPASQALPAPTLAETQVWQAPYLPCSSISGHKLQRAKMPCCVQGSCVDLNTQCTSNLHGMLSDDGKHAPL